ncbi:hypothetical protein IQ576_004558 [Salmonella enterica]|nr:hypothetical protein [Salmonella enterica]EKK0352989.1 hypothetical protein [Salmonella enterica]EKT6688931.1 hypothetical protein [Salmonella enterica]ELN0112737.1 hypothetical protein [Salmonella enterica]
MSAFKFSSLWLLFAATYVVFYGLAFSFFPELWLHNLFREHYQQFIEEGTWDTIFMLAVLLSALVANIALIFLSFAGVHFLRNRIK